MGHAGGQNREPGEEAREGDKIALLGRQEKLRNEDGLDRRDRKDHRGCRIPEFVHRVSPTVLFFAFEFLRMEWGKTVQDCARLFEDGPCKEGSAHGFPDV